ncbi:MAG: hypothetical protein Q9227_007235 [Pyrenula ochraceoflavens]
MPIAGDIFYYLFHPSELRAIIQWKVWHNAVHERRPEKEPASTQICFRFLDMTSRSFSAVIQELHPELLMPVCIFYLVLRGLDTIEDDTSIPAKTKDPLLRNFKDRLEEDGWCFTGNRPEEKDRELLVQFKYIIEEFKKIKSEYREVIKDITNKMGNGMADFCNNAEFNEVGVNKKAEYDLYCYYVAGLVGEGLTRLFVISGFGHPKLLERPKLHESMGLMLQKTNIIRDVREDADDKRRFWPREIWSKHVDNWDDLFKPENREAALNCSSEMVLDAISHVDDCLFYLAGLREQSIFNFCAIPQSMAIATLELCFRNSAMFDRNVKITKGQACKLMTESTQNLQLVTEVFRRYTRKIMKKNTPKDPNFLKISIAGGRIEKFIESIFPSQKPEDIVRKEAPKKPVDPKQAEVDSEARWDMVWMMVAVFGTLTVISAIMIGVAFWLGARFDVAVDELKKGNFIPKNSAEEVAQKVAHGEL